MSKLCQMLVRGRVRVRISQWHIPIPHSIRVHVPSPLPRGIRSCKEIQAPLHHVFYMVALNTFTNPIPRVQSPIVSYCFLLQWYLLWREQSLITIGCGFMLGQSCQNKRPATCKLKWLLLCEYQLSYFRESSRKTPENFYHCKCIQF